MLTPAFKTFLTGGTIASFANYSVQTSTSKPDERVKYGEVVNAFITGGVTFGKKQLYSAAVNGWGAYTTASLQGDNVGVKTSAAVVGSLLGGYIGEKGSQFIANAAIASSIRFKSQIVTNSLITMQPVVKILFHHTYRSLRA
ncbi:hypothetical protein [Undibacterium squillarum]|uniref:hypothetical protein n=1 Tax=Undibacterium squillarum TaxID=1131567 RepID=UPI0035AF1AE2